MDSILAIHIVDYQTLSQSKAIEVQGPTNRIINVYLSIINDLIFLFKNHWQKLLTVLPFADHRPKSG